MRDIRADLRERLAAVAGRYGDAMADFDRDMEALQTRHRETITGLEREQAALEQLLTLEDERARANGEPIPEAPRSAARLLPLGDFLVTKAHAHGPMTKDQLRAEAKLAGYPDGDGRTLNITLMNITRKGRLVQQPDGRYAFPQRTCPLLGLEEQPATEDGMKAMN